MSNPVIRFQGLSRARTLVTIAGDVRVTFWSIGNVVELERDDTTLTFSDAVADWRTADGHRGIVNLSDLVLRAAQAQDLPIEYIEDPAPTEGARDA